MNAALPEGHYRISLRDAARERLSIVPLVPRHDELTPTATVKTDNALAGRMRGTKCTEAKSNHVKQLNEEPASTW